MISAASLPCAGGVTCGRALAMNATVVKPASRAARCAAASMPKAKPLTMTTSGTNLANPPMRVPHMACPYADMFLVPTKAMA